MPKGINETIYEKCHKGIYIAQANSFIRHNKEIAQTEWVPIQKVNEFFKENNCTDDSRQIFKDYYKTICSIVQSS